MAEIPPDFIKGWGKMKATAPDLVKKAGKGFIPAEQRKKLSQDTSALFKTFDLGLKKTLEKVTKTKGVPQTEKVLLEVKGILAAYDKKTRDWAKQGDADLRAEVADMVLGNLKKLTDVITKELAKLK